ncbi:MAG: YqaE/Pmp3 family membrane protein [Cytophagaceae bacterium]|nr:YqaE/Pmp3 family membrane protein [Cytophagaceae bacterium]
MSIAEMILAVFFPPISVLMRYGFGGKFLLNLLLTIVGWLPGVIHAFVILSKKETVSNV